MAFIKFQNVERDAGGRIVSGSASIGKTAYDPSVRGHSRHEVVERLGRVVAMAGNRRSGIFLSPTRGLVSYDADTGAFEPVSVSDARVADLPGIPTSGLHTAFGDVYLLSQFMLKDGWFRVLAKMFVNEDPGGVELFMAHLFHTLPRDGSRERRDRFLEGSALSHLVEIPDRGRLASDSRFYDMMGADRLKVAFLRAMLEEERRWRPRFGETCYIDATPLPNEISAPRCAPTAMEPRTTCGWPLSWTRKPTCPCGTTCTLGTFRTCRA